MPVLQQLGDVVASHSDAPEQTKHLAYLEKRAAQIHYPTFQTAEWPIGCGMVESANELVVVERLKGPGMDWVEGNVNPLRGCARGRSSLTRSILIANREQIVMIWL